MDIVAPTHPVLPLDETGMGRVLVVVAHPDDPEYGTSAAVAEWTSRGIEVGYLLLTKGEAGMQREPAEAGPLRVTEQRTACDVVGVERLTILDFPDGMLEYGLGLRRAVAREIRLFQPDTIVCGAGALFVPWGIDHPDHRAAGLASIDAARDAENRWSFPELLLEEGLEPWGATRLLLSGVDPDRYVAVSDASQAKAIASLAAHEAYLADLPWHPSPEDFIPPILQGHGALAGVPRAIGFAEHVLRG